MSGGNNLESNAGKSDADNPFSRHSTLLGFSASAVVVTLLGWLTQWREVLVPIYIIVGFASVCFFPRLFYGFRAAKLLDNAACTPGSMGLRGGRYLPLRWDGRMKEDLCSAYESAQMGDPSDLKRIAEEERQSQ
jgi:uncharacterized membrane protein YuzA (DUF378 family)